ncbi:hypothetical protein CHU92_11060 [Flavobacterium cyanobacteriorum]|uniref:Uncharacterized protein n=2 Tax=Flavobacterium cyanobacteriorum TaxID=2022802 RepID=A0A255Z121_9FLAO|nr:hypothetical protein CHU92_11060 [Flavobacterium cyanobacteriorum]
MLFGLCSINAQNKIEKITLTYGAELPDDSYKFVKIIGESNNKIYALANKKDDFMLKIFDSSSMKQLSSNAIKLPEMNNREVDFEDIFLLNGKLYAIGSVYNKKDKIFNLVGTPVSDKGELSKNGTILFDAEVEKKSLRGDFYFKQSQDEGALLIMHTSLFNKEDAVKYEIKLFDDNLKTLFTSSEKVHFDDNKKDYQFTIADFELNYKDDVFLVINESYRDSKKKEKVERFEVHAFKHDNNYTKEVINIAFKDKEIINCKMMSTNKDILQLVGFYSSVRESGRSNKELKGVYNATIDIASNKNTNLKFNEFDYNTKVKIMGERRAKKGKDLKPLYAITSIIEKEDGGLILLSELQYVFVGQSQGIGPLAFTPVTYIKNEIIVTSLKADGSHEWSNVVPKDQNATVNTMSLWFGAVGSGGNFAVGMAVGIPLAELGKGPEYLGAIPIYKNGELNVLINDNVKNKGITELDEVKSLGNYNKAVPALFIFDQQGKLIRKDPEEVIKNELVIRPGVFYRKNPKEYIVYSSRKKQDKLGRMILED